MVLVGRLAEREALGGLLARAAEGYSGALVLRGEPGVGKTALLDETLAAAVAAGMQTARLTGVEPETQLGYAGLHRFLLPFAATLEQLPGPQRDALRSTFGMIAGPPADRFLVALAVLTLLAEVASQAPLVCVADDVQWLDPESVVVLGFVARRLYAERVVLLFAVRVPDGDLPALAGLPELAIGGLDDQAALELLASLTSGRLSPAVGADRRGDRRESAGTGRGGPGAVAGPAGRCGAAARAAAYRRVAGAGVPPPGESAAARDTAAAGGGRGRARRLANRVVARGRAPRYRSGRGRRGRSGRPGRDRPAGGVPASAGPLGGLSFRPVAAAAADSSGAGGGRRAVGPGGVASGDGGARA